MARERSSRSRALLVAVALALVLAAATAGAQDPPPEAVVGELPFLEAPTPNAIFIDLATEESARGLLLQLDTGAGTTVLTPALARELGVNVRRLKTTPYRRATRLGRDLQFLVNTRGGDQSARLAPFEYGLLGGNFLSEFVVEIDYPARRVRFLDPDAFAVPETAAGPEEAVVPLRIVGNRPIAKVDLDGTEVEMLVDTGSPLAVLIGGRTARKLAPDPRSLVGFQMFGVVGEIEAGMMEAKRVGFGPFAFAPQPVVVAPRGLYQQGTASDSVLGHDALASFVVRFDYARRRLWLRRTAPLEPRLLGIEWASARRGGALVERHDGRLWVRYVVGDSPADRIGLAPQDLIDGVDGLPPPETAAKLDADLVGGRSITVRRVAGDGEWRAVVLGNPLPGEAAEP